MRGVSLTFDGLSLRGASRAGDRSWFRVDPPGLALDVGRGADALVGTRWIFLSHGHLDHALGLPWVLSQRKAQGLDPATIFCPRALASELESFVSLAGRLEGEELEAEFVGLEPGEGRDLAKGLRLEAFATHHTTPAIGCHLIRARRKLKPEHANRSGEELAALREKGSEVTEERDLLWLSYCGDTAAEVFSSEPRLFETKVLLIECTFIGTATAGRGARFGHLHLDDFVAQADRFENEAIVLTHLSRRHRLSELKAAVASELPGLVDRVHYVAGWGD